MQREVKLGYLQQLLVELKLNDAEAAVFLAAMQTGARPASVIAKRARIKRANCYQILESLLRRGFVQELFKNNVKHFSCVEPDALLGMARQIEFQATEAKKRIESALPLFVALQGKFLAQPKVRYFYGYDGIIQALEDSIKSVKKPIYAVADYSFLHSVKSPELAAYMRSDYIPRRVKNSVDYKGIICRSPGARDEETIREVFTNKKLKRECRLFDGLELSVEILCYDNSIVILSLLEEMYAIRIDDQRLASSFKELHGLIWKTLPVLKGSSRKSTS